MRPLFSLKMYYRRFQIHFSGRHRGGVSLGENRMRAEGRASVFARGGFRKHVAPNLHRRRGEASKSPQWQALRSDFAQGRPRIRPRLSGVAPAGKQGRCAHSQGPRSRRDGKRPPIRSPCVRVGGSGQRADVRRLHTDTACAGRREAVADARVAGRSGPPRAIDSASGSVL